MKTKYLKKAGILLAGLVCAGALLSGCGNSSAGSSQSNGVAGKEKIVIGTQALLAKWTQQSNKSEDGGLEGFDIDVWKEIAKRNNMEIEWRVADFSALWGMLDNGDIQTIANETTPNAKRKEKYNFTEPYAYDGYVFVAPKDGVKKTRDWFKGKKVCVVAAANPQLVLEDMNEKEQMGMDIGYLDVASALMPAVQNGTYDGAFTLKTNAWIVINELKMNMETIDPNYKTLPICYAFTKTPENDKKIEKINKTLADMKQDGTLKQISEKWFGNDVTAKPE